jgi:hypothetical protein
MNILKHTKLKNLTLDGLNKNISEEKARIQREKPHHLLFQQFADDDMYLHEIIIIEKLNIAKNYLNSIEWACMYIFLSGHCRRKD